MSITLERILDGIVARGTIRAGWRAQCSVCLTDLDQVLDAPVDELFEPHPVEGETYPIDGHETRPRTARPRRRAPRVAARPALRCGLRAGA